MMPVSSTGLAVARLWRSDDKRFPAGHYRPDDAWLADRERLKPSVFVAITERPLVTLFAVLLFGALVFGRVLP
jgi:hypothetical protein